MQIALAHNPDRIMLDAPAHPVHKQKMVVDSFSIRAATTAIYTRNEVKIRENVQNAWDAHNPDLGPLLIHLPTTLEPWFSVEDNGRGMSPDDITTLVGGFASTKREKSDQMGGIGIGFLSNFMGGTDVVYVATNNDDTFYVWKVFKDELDDISYTLEHTAPSTKPGTKVTFWVTDDEVGSYTNAAFGYLQYFEPGELECNLDLPPSEITLRGKHFALRHRSNSNTPPTLVIGKLGYRINLPYSIYIQSPALQTMYGDSNGLIVYLPVAQSTVLIEKPGFVTVTLNREELNYNKHTVAVLEDLANKILEELPQHFTHYFDDVKTRWDAAIAYGELTKNQSHLTMKMLNQAPPIWDGEPIKDKYVII